MISFAKVGTYDGTDIKANDTFNCCITKGNYAYIGSLDGLWILNITDPTTPTLEIFSFDTIVLQVVGLAISDDGNTLYAAGTNVGSNNPAVTLIDITTKDNPSEISHIDLLGAVSNPTFLDPKNQHLQLLNANTLTCLFTGGDSNIDRVEAIDITTPASPTFLPNPIGADFKSDVNIGSHIVLGENVHICIDDRNLNSSYTKVYSMTDPSNPSLLGTSDTSFPGEFENAGFSVNGSGIQYMCNQDAGKTIWQLTILDASNPSEISIISTTTLSIPVGQTITQSVVSNDLLVITDFLDSVTLLDVSDASAPEQIQVDSQSGGSVFFSYPYFFTTNAPVMDDVQFYSWLITNISIEGWIYGDNNVIYQAAS